MPFFKNKESLSETLFLMVQAPSAWVSEELGRAPQNK
jgi:hypothetical protein